MRQQEMESKCRVLLVFLAGALFTKEAFAAQHAIGGSQGWVDSADYISWASGQTFKVGDQLVFRYTSGLHSVVELPSETAYKNCDLGTALDSMNSGNDVVKLDKPGTRYFACGTLGHCDQGMKVKITIVSGNAPSTPSSSSSSQSTGLNSSGAITILPFASFAMLVALLATSLLCMF